MSSNPGNILDVTVSGAVVGQLQSLGKDRTAFLPDVSWLETGQTPPLGLAFLGSVAPREGRGGSITPWFENLLPEQGSALRRWLARENGINARDSLAMLACLGADLPGAVEVHGHVGERLTPTPSDETSEKQPQVRFSLTGVQFKLSMARDGAKFVLPAKDETGSWIVKIPDSRHPEIAEVEAATMSWAKQVGLQVPHFEVLPFDSITGLSADEFGRPGTVFAVRRFDRTEHGKQHQEDFAQALEFSPDNKYSDQTHGPGTSYDLLGKLVRDVAPRCAPDFVRRLAFVLASGNGDAHLKNWSFQWSDHHRPWLSPCYDQVATISWEPYGWKSAERHDGPELALKLGKVGSFRKVTRKVLNRFARRSEIPDAEEHFMETLALIRDAWPAIADSAPTRMRESLLDHWQNVPLLRDIGDLEP